MKIWMFVFNNCTKDARVLKEAKCLAREGHEVTIYAVLDKTAAPTEKRDGFEIIRLVKDPLHYKLIGGITRINFFVFSLLNKLAHATVGFFAILMSAVMTVCVTTAAAIRYAGRRISRPVVFLAKALAGIKNKLSGRLKSLVEIITSLRRQKTLLVAQLKTTKSDFVLRLLVFLKRVIGYTMLWFATVLQYLFGVLKWLSGLVRQFWMLIRKGIVAFWRTLKSTGAFLKKNILRQNSALRSVLQRAPTTINAGIREAIIFITMPLHRVLCFADFYFKCYKLSKGAYADVCHAHDLNTLPAAWLCRGRFKTKMVYDSHELYCETSTLSKIEKILSKLVEKFLIKKASSVITVNQSIADELSKRYGIKKPVVIMNCPEKPCEPDCDSGELDLFRSSLNIDKNMPVILYHGGFSPNRGLENLIDAMQMVSSGVLVMMGWGKIEADLKDRTESRNLCSRVKFLPPVPQSDLLRWTKCADVGVIPYQFVGLNNYYSSPNKLFEYIMAGIPVAGSYFPELKKVIEGFNIGKTFNPDDPRDIADTIDAIVSNHDLRRRMKENTKRAAEIYNWENESEKLVDIYRNFGVN